MLRFDLKCIQAFSDTDVREDPSFGASLSSMFACFQFHQLQLCQALNAIGSNQDDFFFYNMKMT